MEKTPNVDAVITQEKLIEKFIRVSQDLPKIYEYG